MPGLKNGMARVEFHAVKPDVDELLAKGHPIISVYRLLKDSGKISMCFGAFKRHLRGPRQKPAPKPKKGAEAARQSPPAVKEDAGPENALPVKTIDSAPRPRGPILARPDKKEGFGKDKISLEDLI